MFSTDPKTFCDLSAIADFVYFPCFYIILIYLTEKTHKFNKIIPRLTVASPLR